MTSTTCSVSDCPEGPFLEHPLTLCKRHAVQVAQGVTDVLYARALVGSIPQVIAEQDTSGLIEGSTIADPAVWKQNSHHPVVYFLANGERVKIGTSTTLRARVAALSLRRGDAILVLNGDHNLEGALHQAFLRDRVGNTEWFTFSPTLRSFITSKRDEGEPLIEGSSSSIRRPDRFGGADPRRQLVFDIVAKTGPDGIGPAAIVDILTRQHPHVTPPNPDVIARWLGADDRIHKPRHGRYAVRPDQTRE